MAILFLLMGVPAMLAGGIRCDGVSDDTAAIQTALNTQRVVKLPSGICLARPLTVPGDRVIEFQPGTTLKSLAGFADGQEFGWSAGEDAVAAHSGFVVAMTAAEPTPLSGRLEFIDCRAEDRRREPSMRLGFYIHSSAPGKRIDALLRHSISVNQSGAQ
jgi:hypothetical protein